jgi:hypothetical protein
MDSRAAWFTSKTATITIALTYFGVKSSWRGQTSHQHLTEFMTIVTSNPVGTDL